MSDIKVAVTSRSFSKHSFLRDEILKKYKYVTFNDAGIKFTPKSLVEFLKGHDRAIIALDSINHDILKELPDLKLISKYGVGLDNIDFQALRDHNVQLSWQGGVNKLAVAELTLFMMLGLMRKSFINNLKLREGLWEQAKGQNLSEKSIGIVGCGHIGKEVIRLLQPFGCKIYVCDIADVADSIAGSKIEQVELDKLLADSDIVSIHLPLTEKTKHIIDSQALSKMRPSAFLVNNARGGVVDQEALKSALKNNVLAGAAFDVFEEEPVQDPELIGLPQFFSTPHIGGTSDEAIIAMGMAAINGLETGQEAIEENFFSYV